MGQDGEAFLYAVAGSSTADYLGTGSLLAPDVVLAHASVRDRVRDGDRVRVQLTGKGTEPEVVDGAVRAVEAGLVFVELDRRAATALAAVRLSEKDLTAERLVDALDERAHENGWDPPPTPPGPPTEVQGRALLRPGGGHGDDPLPPWCGFKPTWPGCGRYRP